VGTYTFTGTPQTVASTSMVISTGSAASPITDAAIAVQLRPTVNVFAFGEEYGF